MDDQEIVSPTEDKLERPDNIFPPGSPCSSLKNLSQQQYMTSSDGEISGEDSEESPTKIFESPLSPDNKKLSELVVELAEKDDDYIGSEVESEFAVWQKTNKIVSDDGLEYEFQSPHDRPPLFVREDGTPTPGSLSAFWDKSIVLSLVEKDGPGNNLTKKPSPMAKKNPITVGVYRDQLFAFNNGAANCKENPNLAQFWYNESSVMRLIPDEEPSVKTIVNPEEATDRGAEMSITPVSKESDAKKKMPEPLECYVRSEYPAYLVLDYKHTPKLLAMKKSELTQKLEDMKKRKSTPAQEKFTPLVNIRRTDTGTPDCVLYFKTANQIHFVQVDKDTKKLTILTKSLVEEVEWRLYRDFKEKPFKRCTKCTVDGPATEPESKATPGEPVTSATNGVNGVHPHHDGDVVQVEPTLKDQEIRQKCESVTSPEDVNGKDDSAPKDNFKEEAPNTPVLSKEANGIKPLPKDMMSPHSHSPMATEQSNHTLSSNSVNV